MSENFELKYLYEGEDSVDLIDELIETYGKDKKVVAFYMRGKEMDLLTDYTLNESYQDEISNEEYSRRITLGQLAFELKDQKRILNLK